MCGPQLGGPGELGLTTETVRVPLGSAYVDVPVYRTEGDAGKVSVEWFTREDSAVDGVDFVDCSGLAHFEDGQTVAMARVNLVTTAPSTGAAEKTFNLELGATEGGCTLGCYETSVIIFQAPGTQRRERERLT